jgi:hypothetical protein
LAFLHDQEAKLIFSLQRSYRDLVQFREEIQTRRSQQEAAARQLKVRLQKWTSGGAESIDLILRAQRNWVDALRDEQVAICNYKIALSDYERQKGTILRSRQIMIADGRLPACVKPGASSQIRDWFRNAPARSAALLPPADSIAAQPVPDDMAGAGPSAGWHDQETAPQNGPPPFDPVQRRDAVSRFEKTAP